MNNGTAPGPPPRKKRLVFTVTNDLNLDQRMIRICTTLSAAGYPVTLIGRKQTLSLPLSQQPYHQHRLPCIFQKGKLFYLEYNLRLLVELLRRPFEVVVAIDLDTLVPCYLASLIKGRPRVYDAHEWFSEMKEVVERPAIYKIWKGVEQTLVPRFPMGYTVNQPIAEAFYRQYGVTYEVIRNLPVADPQPPVAARDKPEKFFLYQGAVNEGRSFETLIPAMQYVDAPLLICGDGNFMKASRELVARHQLQDKVWFTGPLLPQELKRLTRQAWAGITLFESRGLSNYYSLANRFFDYMQAGIPQLCIDFPVYKELNKVHGVAVLCENNEPETIARHLNTLLTDTAAYEQLSMNCLRARDQLHWGVEEKKLLDFYAKHFN